MAIRVWCKWVEDVEVMNCSSDDGCIGARESREEDKKSLQGCVGLQCIRYRAQQVSLFQGPEDSVMGEH